jgi:hypothetical protein
MPRAISKFIQHILNAKLSYCKESKEGKKEDVIKIENLLSAIGIPSRYKSVDFEHTVE